MIEHHTQKQTFGTKKGRGLEENHVFVMILIGIDSYQNFR